MSTRFGLELGVWNYGSGIGEFLDRAVGEIGLTQVSIPAVTGPVVEFRIQPPGGPHQFETRGGWHFRPQRKGGAAGLKPHVSEWLGKRDVLEKLVVACRERGLDVHLRMDVRGGLADRAAGAAVRVNAWGDPMPSTGACSCNAQVRELVGETLLELDTHGPGAIEIMNWDSERLLLGAPDRLPSFTELHGKMCFCASCRQIALSKGIDPDLAARSLRVHLEAEHNPLSTADPVRDDPIITAYSQALHEDQNAWLKQLCRVSETAKYAVWQSARPKPIAPEIRSLMLLHDADEEFVHSEFAQEASHSAQAIAVNADDRHFRESHTLVQFCWDWVAKYKPELFQFRGMERLPDTRLEWVRQAVRYARRDAG